MDGGDYNIPFPFLKKRGDNYYLHLRRFFKCLQLILESVSEMQLDFDSAEDKGHCSRKRVRVVIFWSDSQHIHYNFEQLSLFHPSCFA